MTRMNLNKNKDKLNNKKFKIIMKKNLCAIFQALKANVLKINTYYCYQFLDGL